jgi:hypothetical protein
MSVQSDGIRRVISPLRLIFWGGLICVFDFKINQFDLLNDLVGMIMITWGVFKLSNITVHDRYSTAMLYTKVVAMLSCLDALHGLFAYQVPPFLSTVQSLLGVAAMIATVVFCVAMRWLSIEARLGASARSWRATTVLFTVIYLIPLGVFYCAVAVAGAMGETFNIDLGPAGLLLLPLLLAPLVHLFVSTSRMRREAKVIADVGQQHAAPDRS